MYNCILYWLISAYFCGVMQLNSIQLTQYKNHGATHIQFVPTINGIVGANGVGKTNLLDAVYYLCYARSYFTKTDKALPQFGAQGFRIHGQLTIHNQAYTHTCILRADGKKELLQDGVHIKKTSQYIGKCMAVFIAPDDVALINEGSELRRRYLDMLLCQLDYEYMQQLQTYQKTMLQRNALLKAMHDDGAQDDTLLGIYNLQLHTTGTYIYGQRALYISKLTTIVLSYYNLLAGAQDGIQLSYTSQLAHHQLQELLEKNIYKDTVTQRTNYGIHKDDLDITMLGEPLKQIASQGQKKTLLLALKLAEYQILMQYAQAKPILLLDDIFERLDSGRISQLFEIICTKLGGQVYITDTNYDRLVHAIQAYTTDYNIIQL